MENLKSPISKVAAALKIRCEGLGLRATARVLGTHKQTVKEWEEPFADQKETLMLYAFCHQFVSLTFEGDELYTIVGKRTDPSTSTGWTAVIMERASRFLVDQKCGEKDEGLFKSVMETVGKFIERTGDLTFLSDGERRYGNMLFSFYALRPFRMGNEGVRPWCCRKASKSGSKTRAIKNANVARIVLSTKPLKGSILTQTRVCRTQRFMPTIWKGKTPQHAGVTVRSADERIPMPRRQRDFSEHWMSI